MSCFNCAYHIHIRAWNEIEFLEMRFLHEQECTIYWSEIHCFIMVAINLYNTN